jgi:hypothetical protein
VSVGAATDPKHRTLFGFTSPRTKTDSCGERRKTKNDFELGAMATTW